MAIAVVTGAARAADPIPVSFALVAVEDRYAINLPGFRDLFRMLDVGYAGCRISLRADAGIPPDAGPRNDKLQLRLSVQLGPGDTPFEDVAVGSLARRSVVVYLNNKCAEIRQLQILGAECFHGFKNQFVALPCPYRFRTDTFDLRRFYIDRRAG